MTQDQYDELLDVLGNAESRCEIARRAVLKSNYAAETVTAWEACKREVAELVVTQKAAQETLS